MAQGDINKLLCDISNLKEQLKQKENDLAELMSTACANVCIMCYKLGKI